MEAPPWENRRNNSFFTVKSLWKHLFYRRKICFVSVQTPLKHILCHCKATMETLFFHHRNNISSHVSKHLFFRSQKNLLNTSFHRRNNFLSSSLKHRTNTVHLFCHCKTTVETSVFHHQNNPFCHR